MQFQFVHKNARLWHALREGAAPDPDTMPEMFQDAQDCWAALTYLRLCRSGLPVSLSLSIDPRLPNLVYHSYIGGRDLSFNAFIVCLRADSARCRLTPYHIVQNPANADGLRSWFIPHWPQPGLVPRDSSRGTSLSILAFKGSPMNLDSCFRSKDFQQELAVLGVKLVLHEGDIDKRTATTWADYSRVDAVIAVRNLTVWDATIKPASKLVNAWHAGVPALLGPEPAYRGLRRSDLDYFEVRSPSDALSVIRRLKAEPSLYQRIVENGRARSKEFTNERIIEKWAEILRGPIWMEWEKWRRGGALMKAYRLVRFPAKVLLERAERRRYFKLINLPPRILDI